MRPIRAALLAGLLLLAWQSSAGAASPRAARLDLQAKAASDRGQFAKALSLYERANAIERGPHRLFGAAMCLLQLNRQCEAVAAFNQLLAAEDASVPTKFRALAARHVAELASACAPDNPPPDSVPPTTTPSTPPIQEPIATKAPPVARVPVVPHPPKPPPPTTSATSDAPPTPGWARRHPASIALGSSALALAALGGGLGGWTATSFQSDCAVRYCNDPDLAPHGSRALATNLTFVGAGVAAVVAVIVYFAAERRR